MTENPKTCQKCGSPITAGMKFCETCGTKIDVSPSCPWCGAAHNPDSKFCENCGKSTGTPGPVAAEVPIVAISGTPAAEEPAVEGQPAINPSPAEPVPVEEKATSNPENKPSSSPANVREVPVTENLMDVPAQIVPKKPVPRQTLIIAGIILLALIGAVVYFVVLPMIPGIGTAPLTVLASGTATPAETRSLSPPAGSSAGVVSFVTEPTQVPPAKLLVTYTAERDPITGLVTITFTGGAGQNGVRDVFIRLTRSDGEIITRTKTFTQILQTETLQGTKTGDDRVEVTANYYNGEHYKIIDQILEYKKR
jgi:hypothetical protein